MKRLTVYNKASEPGLGRTEGRALGNSCHRRGQWYANAARLLTQLQPLEITPTDPLLLCCSFSNICLSVLHYVTTFKPPKGGEELQPPFSFPSGRKGTIF